MPEPVHPRVGAFNCPNCGAGVAPDSVRCPYCRSAIATLVCPSCYGSVAVGARHCQFCGTTVEPPGSSPEASVKCPRCESLLFVVPVGRNQLHECLACGGLWLSKDSFQDICTRQEEQEAILNFRSEAKPARIERPGAAGRAYVPCPECGKLMNRENFAGCSGVVLDWCRDHGSWFDRQELQQIVSFIKNGGLRKARDREQTKLQEEKQRLRAQQLEMAIRAGRDVGTVAVSLDASANNDSFFRLISKMIQP